MGGGDDFGASGGKSSESSNDLSMFNAENLESNMKVIYYGRTFLSIIGGVIAGILGFTGITGFIFYFLVMTLTSAGLVIKAKFSVPSYFDGWNRVIFDGFLSGLMDHWYFFDYRADSPMTLCISTEEVPDISSSIRIMKHPLLLDFSFDLANV